MLIKCPVAFMNDANFVLLTGGTHVLSFHAHWEEMTGTMKGFLRRQDLKIRLLMFLCNVPFEDRLR